MRKRNKYRPVYKKGRKTLYQKIDTAVEKYNKFLESTRDTGKKVQREYKKIKKSIKPGIEETKKTWRSLKKELAPTRKYLQTTRENIQREFNAQPTQSSSMFEPALLPEPIESRDLWTERPTRGLSNGKKLSRFNGPRRLPRLF